MAISAAPIVSVEGTIEQLTAGRTIEVIRDPSAALCREYGFQTIYEMPADLQMSVRRRLIAQHADEVRKGGERLFDHSVFGWVADWMRWFWNETKTLDWESVWSDAQKCATLYDEIHHVEGGPARVYDSYYWLDRANSAQIERLLKMLYNQFGVAGRVRFHGAS